MLAEGMLLTVSIFRKLGQWLDVHEDEVGLFLWTVALLFLVRSAGILLNNYAETAFLKRYGVEYLPIVNMINAVATFFVMGIVTGFMTRLPGARLLAYLFIFCGFSVAAIRLVIPFGVELIYPLLFMLKSQYEVLLALLFWNLANDLFNTRQSKRLFPLITAGGVIGQILGSFATPLVARWMNIDDMLWVYLVTALSGAAAVLAMGRRYPTLLFQQAKSKQRSSRPSMIDEFRTVLPLMKRSVLVKILVALTFLPNVVIPIMNYQFNFAVNEQFATESGLIDFFGYFRGVLNIVSLVILLFVGKLYNRFGLSVALMFHPFNYIIVFTTFLLRFDAVSAIYARMSSNIIRTTINLPATAVVTGLFPESYRAMIRPFLRGTVVRIGLFLGSGIILASDTLFHPRYLSLAAMPFVLAWAVTPFVLKRHYVDILLGLVTGDKVDIRTLESAEVARVFREARVETRLMHRFLDASPANQLWYGRLLKTIAPHALDQNLPAAIRHTTDSNQRRQLVELFSDGAGAEAVALFNDLAGGTDPALIAAMVGVAHRISAWRFAPFLQIIADGDYPLKLKAPAVGALYTVTPQHYEPIIDSWLASGKTETRCAGIAAVGISRDKRYEARLKQLLTQVDDDAVLRQVLESLKALEATGLNERIAARLQDPDPALRRAVLGVYEIVDEPSLKAVIPLLGDEDKGIAEAAREKIRSAAYQNSHRLIKAISLPQRKVREGLFELLETMSIKDLDVFRFVRSQAQAAYTLLVQQLAVRRCLSGPLAELLRAHLEERVWFLLQTVLRVLAAQDRSGRIRTVSRGLFAADSRQRANSLEAMVDIMDRNLSKVLIPLFEDMDITERIAVGRRYFTIDESPQEAAGLIAVLLESGSAVTLILTLALLQQMEDGGEITPDRVAALINHENPFVARSAKRLLAGRRSDPDPKETAMPVPATIELSDKILHLRNIEIFAELTVNELAAIASVTEETTYDEGSLVFREGESGETLYLVVDGEVKVVKDCNADKEIELDTITAGDYFGEMALFGDDLRSATIRVAKPSRFLTLSKQELQEIVREYPQIALHVCKVLSGRIRRLHGKISDQSC